MRTGIGRRIFNQFLVHFVRLPVRGGLLLLTTWILPLLSIHAADFRVDGFLASSGRDLVIEHASQTDAYYQIWVKSEISDPWIEVRHMHLGEEGTQTWADTSISLPTARGYYRLLRIPCNAPRDYDTDGINDVYELERTFLDPLDPSDASEDQDEDTVSNLSEYLGGTSPDNPDSDEDGIQDGTDPRPVVANVAPVVQSVGFSSEDNFHDDADLTIHVTAIDEDGDAIRYESSIDEGTWCATPGPDRVLPLAELRPGNLSVGARAGDPWGSVSSVRNASRYIFPSPPTP